MLSVPFLLAESNESKRTSGDVICWWVTRCVLWLDACELLCDGGASANLCCNFNSLLDWSCWTYLLVASDNVFVIFVVFSQDGGRKLFPRCRRSSRPCHSRRWAELWLTRRCTNRARGDWEGNSCAQLRHWECFLPLLTERVITPESFRAAPRFGCAADILHPVCFGATSQCCK